MLFRLEVGWTLWLICPRVASVAAFFAGAPLSSWPIIAVARLLCAPQTLSIVVKDAEWRGFCVAGELAAGICSGFMVEWRWCCCCEADDAKVWCAVIIAIVPLACPELPLAALWLVFCC